MHPAQHPLGMATARAMAPTASSTSEMHPDMGATKEEHEEERSHAIHVRFTMNSG